MDGLPDNISPEEVLRELRNKTALDIVYIKEMLNDVTTDLEDYAKLAKQLGIPLYSDGVIIGDIS